MFGCSRALMSSGSPFPSRLKYQSNMLNFFFLGASSSSSSSLSAPLHPHRRKRGSKRIEKAINKEYSYFDRLRALNNGTQFLIQQKRKLELSKIKIRSLSISELCDTFKICETSSFKDIGLTELEAVFIKCLYPIYYNVIPYLLGLNVGKTKKANSGRKFPKLMAR